MLSFYVTWTTYPYLVILGGSSSNWACSPPLSLVLLTTKLLLSSLPIGGSLYSQSCGCLCCSSSTGRLSVSIKGKGTRNDFPQRILSIYSISTACYRLRTARLPGSTGEMSWTPVSLFAWKLPFASVQGIWCIDFISGFILLFSLSLIFYSYFPFIPIFLPKIP